MFMAAVSGALLHPFFVGHFYPVNPASNRIKSGVGARSNNPRFKIALTIAASIL
jgi:hypothetical protein